MRWCVSKLVFADLLDLEHVRVFAAQLEKTVPVVFLRQFHQDQLGVRVAFPRPTAYPGQVHYRGKYVKLVIRRLLILKGDSETMTEHPAK